MIKVGVKKVNLAETAQSNDFKLVTQNKMFQRMKAYKLQDESLKRNVYPSFPKEVKRKKRRKK